MMNRSPAFQFYPKDWLTSEKVITMTNEERGEYITLLCYDWINNGISEAVFKGSSTNVQVCFKQRGNKYFNPRLDEERKKQKEWREKCAEGGRKSAEMKKRSKQQEELSKDSTKVSSRVVPTVLQVNANSSSSSSSITTNKDLNTYAQTPKSSAQNIEFSYEEQRFFNISEKQIEIWKEAYPAVDIPAQIKRAAQWLVANPKKRKKNYHKFLTNWFGRGQERGGDIGSNRIVEEDPFK